MSVLKVHYFLWFGALSGIMPFTSIFAKEHSIATATDVGILYCVLPFIVSIIKPFFCSVADRNNSHRKVLIVSIIVTIVGYGLLLTIIFIKIQRISWYWFCLLILMANSGQGVVISLNDYLVMKEVTQLSKTFGSYRVWGTIGWGSFGVIAGVVNEYIKQLPYLLPGLIMFIIIEFIDLITILLKLQNLELRSENYSIDDQNSVPQRKSISEILVNSLNSSLQSLKQIFRIFRNNPSLLQYVFIIVMFGALTAFHWTYYFWYLETIRGKEQLLFGLALLVQSFLGELPIFLVSDRILRYCGPSLSLSISLLAFAVRFLVYGYVFKVGNSYWDVLLIEVLQGLTFSLFYTTMATLAQTYANHERDRLMADISLDQRQSLAQELRSKTSSEQSSYATLQGILSASFEGIGLGMGALVGGWLIDNLKEGLFNIWKIGAFMALASILLNTILEGIKYLYRNFVKNKE